MRIIQGAFQAFKRRIERVQTVRVWIIGYTKNKSVRSNQISFTKWFRTYTHTGITALMWTVTEVKFPSKCLTNFKQISRNSAKEKAKSCVSIDYCYTNISSLAQTRLILHSALPINHCRRRDWNRMTIYHLIYNFKAYHSNHKKREMMVEKWHLRFIWRSCINISA